MAQEEKGQLQMNGMCIKVPCNSSDLDEWKPLFVGFSHDINLKFQIKIISNKQNQKH